MWPAFPASDYYGRSATRSPHRRGFNRARAAYPCGLPTRPGFPGSFADTRTLPLRPRPFCTRQRTAAPPDTGGHTWPCRRPRTLAGPSERDAEKHGVRPSGPFPIPGSLRPDGFSIRGIRGLRFPKVLVDSCSWSYGSSTWRNFHGYEASPVFRFVRGTVWPTDSHVPSTYPVGTVARHQATVQMNIADKVTSPTCYAGQGGFSGRTFSTHSMQLGRVGV